MWRYPKIIAHRGGGTLAPENTLAALRCALAYGFRAVEFDVMALPDGTLVLLHDTELGRTVAGSGSIAGCSGAWLVGADAGSWFAPRFAGEPVPTLAQAAAFCMKHGLSMNVEIKPLPGAEADTGARVARACAALAPQHVLLSSFSEDALHAARHSVPGLPRALLVHTVPPDWHARLTALHARALHAQATALNAAQITAVKAAGFDVMAYTVNELAQARALFAQGVDAICTDRLDLIPPDFAEPTAS